MPQRYPEQFLHIIFKLLTCVFELLLPTRENNVQSKKQRHYSNQRNLDDVLVSSFLTLHSDHRMV